MRISRKSIQWALSEKDLKNDNEEQESVRKIKSITKKVSLIIYTELL